MEPAWLSSCYGTRAFRAAPVIIDFTESQKSAA
jgi:hypothetical protein